MLSLVIEMDDKVVIEVATIGNEGMAGTALLLGAEQSATKAFSQVAGEVLKPPAREFTSALAIDQRMAAGCSCARTASAASRSR